MLKVIYEYQCDICGSKIGEEEHYVQPHWEIPRPSMIWSVVGNDLCCESCLQKAQAVLYPHSKLRVLG